MSDADPRKLQRFTVLTRYRTDERESSEEGKRQEVEFKQKKKEKSEQSQEVMGGGSKKDPLNLSSAQNIREAHNDVTVHPNLELQHGPADYGPN